MQDTYCKRMQSIFITVTLMRLLGMWYTSNKREKIIADISTTVVVSFVLFSSLVESNQMYYARNSLVMVCGIAPGFFALYSELIKLLVFCANRKKVMKLNKYMYEHFWNVEYNKEETLIFNECNDVCVKALIGYIILLQVIVVHMTIAPYLEPRDNSTLGRIELPFPIYVNFPIYESPTYEILFTLQTFGLQGVVLCLISFPIFLMVTNMFTAVQFKILNVRMQSLCKFPENKNGVLNLQHQMHVYEKLKDYIRKHQLLIYNVNELDNLYSYAMLGQVFASILQLSSTSITVLLSNKGEESANQAILRAEMLMASILQFYFYAFSSHKILTESEKISEAIYSSDWFHMTHARFHKHFSLLVQIISIRAQRPCILTVGKYCPLTLITFTTVMRMSMSFFTLIRQTI